MLDTSKLDPRALTEPTRERHQEAACTAPPQSGRHAECLRLADLSAKRGVEVHLAVHDLRNSLSTAALNASLLARRIEGQGADAASVELLELVRRDLRHVHDTLDGVIALIEDDGCTPEPIDVAALMDDVQRIAKAAAQLTGDVRISVTEPREPLFVRGAPRRLDQAIFALVRNAIEASSAGGEVRIEVDGQDGAVCIRVRDQGPGLASPQREHVFQEFESTKPTGLGVGLAVARKIVADHGGSLTLTSTFGNGVCAEIRLPRTSPSSRSPGNDQ